MSTTLDAPARPAFEWQRFPKTDAFLAETVEAFLGLHPFASQLAGRMLIETGTRFGDWIDHLSLPNAAGLAGRLADLGYAPDTVAGPDGAKVFVHQGGLFPRVVLGGSTPLVALKVESIASFSRAHDLMLTIAGPPLGPYRTATIPATDEAATLMVVERRGYRGFEAYPGDLARLGRMTPHAARDVLKAKELWQARRRRFDDDEEGFAVLEATLKATRELVDRDTTCHLFFEADREYWELRNRAARVQKERQDRLGLGWANHDHHTFRCSRRFFPRIIAFFEQLGCELREGFHAGHHAGWGAQVLEHPVTGIVIFADLDLAPEEADHDFAHEALPDLPVPNTVGLWVGLHGESILEAGMHHLEAQFDFEALRDGLQNEAGIVTMKPFSDFPFLRQAFTQGERWPVARLRADRLLADGRIDADQHARFVAEGAIGSHLENLQRREGYKGFNQQAVSAIIAETDPRRPAPSPSPR